MSVDKLRDRFVEPLNASPEKATMFDFLADYIAVLHSSEFIEGGAQMSKNTREKFVMGMMKKRAQGQL